ncbi:MAG: tRNA (adenosine(37)-N6)-threonylcarbamoyltransferase complex dimerization subunit type 1 TsaB [Planctomycetia bacterium]|nr:tRNA (adenosine(37)-N6)-threonylcarbamoyltransferase complex dimerization subunit type 1 TsaB [Planctomycetia bacterium]
MNLLAVETMGVSASAAILEDGQTVASLVLEEKARSSEMLVPMVQTLLEESRRKPADIDWVAVTRGPGSFTGLRVGITFAKVFAYSVGAKLLGIDTLEAIAAGVPGECSPLAVVLDAQRGEIVTRTYAFAEGTWTPTDAMRLVDWDDWLRALPEETYLTGPLLSRKAKRLAGRNLVDTPYWNLNPAVLGEVAYGKIMAGAEDELWTLLPFYSRLAAAEERKLQKNS